jgi:hypothetical protein
VFCIRIPKVAGKGSAAVRTQSEGRVVVPVGEVMLVNGGNLAAALSSTVVEYALVEAIAWALVLLEAKAVAGLRLLACCRISLDMDCTPAVCNIPLTVLAASERSVSVMPGSVLKFMALCSLLIHFLVEQ